MISSLTAQIIKAINHCYTTRSHRCCRREVTTSNATCVTITFLYVKAKSKGHVMATQKPSGQYAQNLQTRDHDPCARRHWLPLRHSDSFWLRTLHLKHSVALSQEFNCMPLSVPADDRAQAERLGANRVRQMSTERTSSGSSTEPQQCDLQYFESNFFFSNLVEVV